MGVTSCRTLVSDGGIQSDGSGAVQGLAALQPVALLLLTHLLGMLSLSSFLGRTLCIATMCLLEFASVYCTMEEDKTCYSELSNKSTVGNKSTATPKFLFQAIVPLK